MHLRFAEPKDVTALARLGIRSFVTKFGHLYRAEDLNPFLATAYSEANIAAEIEATDMRVILAEEEGSLVGYSKLRLKCGWPEHSRGQKVIELKQLYTDPDKTGQGIGAQLMECVLQDAQSYGADEIQLSVFSENLGAQAFYTRWGFSKVADIHFMVGAHRDDEFLFSRLFHDNVMN